MASRGVLPRRDGHATPCLGRDVGHGLGERPQVPGQITNAVLPLAVRLVGWLTYHLAAGCNHGTMVRIDILDANHYRLPDPFPSGRCASSVRSICDDHRTAAGAELSPVIADLDTLCEPK